MSSGSHFVFKLIPPRPTFAMDFTPEEGAIMAQHIAYWTGRLQRGEAVAFGPVADPAGSWGLGVIAADRESDVHEMAASDPAITSGLATYEVCAMPGAIVRPRPTGEFVFMTIHYPKPEHRQDLLDGMAEMAEIMAASPGFIEAGPWREDGDRIVGISRWESEEAFRAAAPPVSDDPESKIHEWETRPRERFMLTRPLPSHAAA